MDQKTAELILLRKALAEQGSGTGAEAEAAMPGWADAAAATPRVSSGPEQVSANDYETDSTAGPGNAQGQEPGAYAGRGRSGSSTSPHTRQGSEVGGGVRV